MKKVSNFSIFQEFPIYLRNEGGVYRIKLLLPSCHPLKARTVIRGKTFTTIIRISARAMFSRNNLEGNLVTVLHFDSW